MKCESSPSSVIGCGPTKDQGPRTKDQGPRTKDQGGCRSPLSANPHEESNSRRAPLRRSCGPLARRRTPDARRGDAEVAFRQLRRCRCPVRSLHPWGSEAHPRVIERWDPLGPCRSGETAVIGDLFGDAGQQGVEERRAGRIWSREDGASGGVGIPGQVVGERSQTGPVGLVLTGVVGRPCVGQVGEVRVSGPR